VYVVGDIHGRPDLLLNVQRRIDEDKTRFAHGRVVELYLGDYIDRGPDPAGVVGRLIDRARRVDAEFLRGNHEQLLLDFLDGRECLDEWLSVGGITTLLSYGVTPGPSSRLLAGDVIRRRLGQAIPPEHRRFYEKTGSYIRLGDYLAVHAGIRPGVPLEDQTAADLLSIRKGFLQFDGDFGFVVVHGHTRVEAPELRPNRINIDTGAFATNRLTCLRIDADGARVLRDDGLETDLAGGIEAVVGDRTGIPKGDPFCVLGVGRRASAREIRAAYLRLVKELHPDGRLDDPIAAERLKAINHAYQELKGHGRRAEAREAERSTSGRRLRAIFLLAFVSSSALLLAPFAYLAGFLGSQHASKTATGPAISAISQPGTGLEIAWTDAKRTATREAWERFIEAYPDGDHAAKARQALAAIEAAEARQKADHTAWAEAEGASSREAYSAYLRAYPNGRHAERARARLAEMEGTEGKAGASAAVNETKPTSRSERQGAWEPAAGGRRTSVDDPFTGADARIRR
jgi:serine/threonine protein phosphatase 1